MKKNNKYGHETLWLDLAYLQKEFKPDDSFSKRHKDKLKLLYWLIGSCLLIYTAETVAVELAMKLGVK
jgi:hypothetical protein